MAKSKVTDDTALVTEYIQKLEPSFAKLVGEGLVKINDSADMESKGKAVKKVIKEWLKFIDK